MKALYAFALMLGLSAAASASGLYFAMATYAPNGQLVCDAMSTTSAISCVSDAGTAAYAAISASPLANGFTFTETFDMGPTLYQSFGNLDLRAFDLVTDPLSPSGFYTMTVLEQATCTSNIAGLCGSLGFQFSEYPPQSTALFTSSPQLVTVTGSVFDLIDAYQADVFSDHTTVANEATTISGSLQIEDVTFSPTLPAPVPEPNNGLLLWMSLIGTLTGVRLGKRPNSRR